MSQLSFIDQVWWCLTHREPGSCHHCWRAFEAVLSGLPYRGCSMVRRELREQA